MNRQVLAEAGVNPQHWETARLDGFDLVIRPRANLVSAADKSVWGVLASLPHDELSRLYAHAKDVLGEVYLPEAVLVSTSDEEVQPALCYICASMSPRPAERDYVERILAPAREAGLPESYITRIEAWLPPVVTMAQYDIHTDVKHGHGELIDSKALADACAVPWWNQTLCQVNDCVVRLGVFHGEFHWHKHDREDEFFQVCEGELLLDFRDRTINLKPGQGVLVARGIEHRTRAPNRTVVLMVEAATVKPTGD